ncbi:MAG TPA: thioredoxin domain-containing protein [Candidatus Solibacter sp.]|nr:thioredoxin domain-containing protein [Candidatus Solibacter sp.]
MVKAKFVPIHLLLSLVFMAGGCKAQTATKPGSTAAGGGLPSEVVQRIETAIRAQYNVPRGINLALSDPKPSDQQGYDQFTVTFTGGKNTSTHDFLISKDRKTLAHLEKIDLAKIDLPADLMAKIDVRGRPVRGNKAATVTIVNYDDFQCPFCSRMHATLFPSLLQQYGDKVRFIYKDYPLVEIHPWAMHAAVDANCLADQNNDAYWEFADYIHSNQRKVAGANSDEAFANLDKAAQDEAGKFKLDEPKLSACMKKQDQSAVRASMAQAEKVGVDSTPTLFINGERISGAVPEEEMRTIIDRALTDAGKSASPNARK